MSITIKTDEQTVKFLSDFLSSSIYGQCYPFAIAMHRGLGWQLVGLFYEGMIIHAGVRSPEGKIWDGRGKISDADFITPFANEVYSAICNITEEDLLSRDDTAESLVDFYTDRAQVVWSNLPWNKPVYQENVIAFAKELEELSRKYKLWVCGPYPAATPVLFQGYDDEKGYELTRTSDGVTYKINRVL